MPRPTRSHGRPGTRVVPANFERDHAAVIDKTLTASGRIWAPGTPATINADLTYSTAADTTPVYAGAMRVQELNRNEVARLFGDEFQAVTVYLVVIAYGPEPITRGCVLSVDETSDPTLVSPRTLTVARVTRGSIRWERDLYCVDVQDRRAAS